MFVRIPSLNASITVVDFLLATRIPDAVGDTVCVVHEVVPPNEIRVTWWLTHEEMMEDKHLSMPAPLSIDSYSNVLRCHIKEVFEDCTTSSAVSIVDVKDVAFVFHPDTLEKHHVSCHGMIRVYFTCFHLNQDSTFSYVNIHNHYPFSSVCCESYPSRIWFFILEVKGNLEKVLNDAKQFQPCRKMTMMKCSLECWYYFCLCMMNSGATFFHFSRNHTDNFFHYDLTLSSTCTKKHFHLVRFDSERSLIFAQKLFGVTFGIGIRNRPQKKGETPVTMHHGDIVNLVDVQNVSIRTYSERLQRSTQEPKRDPSGPEGTARTPQATDS